MGKKKLSIAIPASILSQISHLREKTSQVGLIGRTASIFRINEVIVYLDDPKTDQNEDIKLIAKLLSYLDTPQYLRKKLFGIRPELRYVGILPPLRTPHHPLSPKMENLKIGEYREGAVLSKKREGVLVDIGVEKPALIRGVDLPMGTRVTIRIKEVNKGVKGEITTREKPPRYWGYKVRAEEKSLTKILEKGDFDLTIATSKYGIQFPDLARDVKYRQEKADNILVAFGAPSRGLHEIVQQEGAELQRVVDFVINTIPKQGTGTVRTEEALIASLAVLNVTFVSHW